MVVVTVPTSSGARPTNGLVGPASGSCVRGEGMSLAMVVGAAAAPGAASIIVLSRVPK